MPRRARAAIRPDGPDSQHRSRLVQQVINKVMLAGKKSRAEQIVYDALAIVGERTGRPPVEVLDEAIKELTPVLEVSSRRVGGATYQVPVEVPARRARTLAVRWLVEFARNRREKSMSERLANEIIDSLPAAGRRLEAQGRHLPHGAGQQGLRPLPLVDKRPSSPRLGRHAHPAEGPSTWQRRGQTLNPSAPDAAWQVVLPNAVSRIHHSGGRHPREGPVLKTRASPTRRITD